MFRVQPESRPAGSSHETVTTSTAPAGAIALCRRCRRSVLPALAAPSWHKEVHRAAADGMVRVDPATERQVARAKRRNNKKDRRRLERAALRAARRGGDLSHCVRLFIDTRTESFARSRQVVAASEDCQDCLKLQASRKVAA